MSTIYRTAVASVVVGAVAALSPLSAQAKDEPALASNTSIRVESCASQAAAAGTGLITGSVAAGLNFKVVVPDVPTGAVYESRARVYNIVNGKKNFSTKRTRVSNTLDTASGSVPAGYFIWRFDVVNLTAEAAGAATSLAYTSAGFVNCD
jgi:hypothetical protein